MANYDLENTVDVINSGISRFNKKSTAMLEQLKIDQDELLGKIGRLQSGELRSGLIDDDGTDIVMLADEIEESVSVNLGQLQEAINSWGLTVDAALAGAGFMRLDKTGSDQEA